MANEDRASGFATGPAVLTDPSPSVSAVPALVPDAGIHPDILNALGVEERANRAMDLLALIAGAHPLAVSCDDPRLDPFTDDFSVRDTCNLLFDIEWIDQLGSGGSDNFRIVMMPKGLEVAQAIEARRAETLGSVHESAVPQGCADTSEPSA